MPYKVLLVEQSATRLPNLNVLKTEHTLRAAVRLDTMFKHLAYDWTVNER